MARRITSRQPVLGAKRVRYERVTKFAGQSVYLDPAPYRDHVLALTAMKLPITSIARDAGVSDLYVYDLRDGKYPTIRVRPARAIMAVTHHPNPRQQRVLAIGAIRRLRALRAIGWSWAPLASRTGLNASTLQVLANTGRDTVTWETWLAIHTAYESLSGTPGSSNRVPHPAPLDWEGHDIDDPRVQVTAAPYRPLTAREQRAARAATVAELTEAGLSSAEIADRLKIPQRSVTRIRSSFAAA